MTRQQITQTLSDEALKKRVDEFLDKEKAAEVYEAEKLKIIQEKLVKRCQESGEDEALKKMAQHLKQRGVLAQQYKNLRGREYDLRLFETSPVQNNLQGLVSQMASPMMQWSSSNPWWRADVSGYGDQVPSFPSSFIGGSKDARDFVRNDRRPIVFTQKPPSSYRNMVLDEVRRVRRDLERNAKITDVFLDENRHELTDLEEKQVRGIHPALDRLSNVAEATTSIVGKGLARLGQGIFSKTNAIDTNRFKRLREEQNKMISQMMWNLGQHPRYGGAYLRALQKINDQLADSPDLLDQVQFHEMQKLITDEIKKVEKASAEDVKSFNDSLQEINNNILAGLKKQVVTEDDMMKFRALQMFLLIAPFGGLAVFGLSNYLSVFGNLFGPLFDATLNFGEGLGHVITSDVLGPFGDIADALELDKLVELITDHVPVVHEVTSIIDTVANEAGGLFGIMGQALTGSATPMIGIALVNSLLRAKTEAEHHTAITKFEDDEREKLHALQKSFLEKITTGPDSKDRISVKKRILEFAEKEYQTRKFSDFYVQLANFIANADSKTLQIFNDVKFPNSNGNESETFAQIFARKGSLSQADVLNLLMPILDDKADQKQPEERRTRCMHLAAVFDKMRDGAKSTEEALANFKKLIANKTEFDKAAKEQIARLSQQYTESLAARKGFYSQIDEKDAVARCADLEMQMIGREFERRFELEKKGTQSVDDLPDEMRTPGKSPAPFYQRNCGMPIRMPDGGRGGSAPIAA